MVFCSLSYFDMFFSDERFHKRWNYCKPANDSPGQVFNGSEWCLNQYWRYWPLPVMISSQLGCPCLSLVFACFDYYLRLFKSAIGNPLLIFGDIHKHDFPSYAIMINLNFRVCFVWVTDFLIMSSSKSYRFVLCVCFLLYLIF